MPAALHRLADRLHLRLILGLDLGDLRLLRLGQLDTGQRSIEPPTTASRTPLLLGTRRGSGILGAGDRGAAGEESDAERRDAENLHEGHLCRWMNLKEI